MEREPTPIRIAGVPEHYCLPWQLGLERRAFIRAGVDLKWRTIPQGTGAMCELLRRGEVDLAVLVTEGAVRDILNGAPTRMVANFVDSPLNWGVHVGAGTALRTLEDLQQVPFAISRYNSGSHLAAIGYARTQGRDLTQEDFIVVNDLKGALERLAMPEPAAFLWDAAMVSPFVDRGILRRLDVYGQPWPSFVVVARNDVLANEPEAIRRLLKVVRDQARGLMARKNAPELIAQRFGLSVEAARAWFGTVHWDLEGAQDHEAVRTVHRFLVEQGLVGSPIDGDIPPLWSDPLV